MTCIDVSENYLVTSKGLHIDCFDHTRHTFFDVPNKPGSEENDHIADIAISSDSKYLASITSTSKQLVVCSLPLEEKVKTYELPRSASRLRFTANNSQILVADKSGDVLLYDLTTESSGIKLLGHLSLLLDVLQTNDGQFVITSDRDEKIKVSRFPNTYNIETYCLGHKEFVNHIEILPHNDKYLTSSSGDGTVKFWDYARGTLTYTINAYLDVDDATLNDIFAKIMDEEGVEVNALPVVHYAVTKLGDDRSLLAVAVHSYDKLLIYSLKTNKNHLSHRKEQYLELDKFPASIKFHKHSLYLYDDYNSVVTIMKVVCNHDKISFEFNKNIKMFDTKMIKFKTKTSIEAIKILYKRKFDNVQEYQERKKQRLEKTSQ